LSEADYSKWTRRVAPEPGDIVFTYEATLHRYAVIPQGFRGCLGRRVALIRPDREQVDVKFLLYYFLSEKWRAIINEKIISGATVDRIPLIDFPEFRISLPPLPIQRKIAAILTAYDDLIENNRRRIALLEQMAEAIYREWFVRLRFPGHETVPIEQGVPAGWEVKNIEEICKVSRGSSPRPINDSKYFIDGTIPWIKIADATASKIFIYETKEYVNDVGASYSRKLPQGSLIIATSGTLGFCIFLGIEGCVHDGWMYLSEYKENIKATYLYYVINQYRDHLNNLSYGAAIQNINTEIVRKLSILKPPSEVLDNFYSTIDPILDEIFHLGQKNRLIAKTRDLLLPRLLSGKLAVDALDIQFPPHPPEAI
jgi:type I restriction enzyme S subunit